MHCQIGTRASSGGRGVIRQNGSPTQNDNIANLPIDVLRVGNTVVSMNGSDFRGGMAGWVGP
jgi:hypothetical protein